MSNSELILNTLAEANGVLSKQKPDHPSTVFWKKVVDVLKVAYLDNEELKWIQQQNYALIAENKFLQQYAGDARDRLQVYETLKSEILAGTLQEKVKKVDEILKNAG